MRSYCNRLIFIYLLIFGCLFTTSSGHCSKHKHHNDDHQTKCFQHDIQLQLSDSLGFPVPGTEFWVILDIIKDGPKVTIQLPLINFETGPRANNPIELPFQPLLPGGYLYTATGFLPKDIRPTDLVPRSIVAASNNGLSPVFSYAQDPATLPVPPAGYIVQVTNAGAIVVQCVGTFGNIIPPGPQILMPSSITYVVKPEKKLCKNIKISEGFTNTTQFTTAAVNGVRDSHINDIFDGVAAWAWCDNSTVADKSNNTLNLMVAIGRTGKDGKLKVSKPVQLTNLPPGVGAWDTAVSINRTDKNIIVVSYGVINYSDSTAPMLSCRAVSFDGGKTWPAPYDYITEQPYNGQINIHPSYSGGFGDNRGVSSDRYGNTWYSSSNFFDALGNFVNQPIYAVSTDGGITFQVVYTQPLVPPDFDPAINFYDFGQFCFGNDAQGNYGLYFSSTLYNTLTGDGFPTVGFIPITGLGQFGTPSFTRLQSFTGSIVEMDITASSDGRVWLQGYVGTNIARTFQSFTYIQPEVIAFKSPGPIDQNWVGAWDYIISNNISQQFHVSGVDAQPRHGFFNCPQSILYDEGRQALYALFAAQNPDYSQNMRIYFIISRDNGQTWSDPIGISSTNFANRGFQSMALDKVTGDLIFGWYDGRNDPTFRSLQYFGAILSAKKLDALVERIPLSNPLFTLPSANEALPVVIELQPEETNEERAAEKQKLLESKFGIRYPPKGPLG